MSHTLDALRFPLSGSRLIEASAGTGKTWTIAALYVRLVLGHGACGFEKGLMPGEILVMTFTRAATRELSERVRERLVETSRYFRGEAVVKPDPFLVDLAAAYPDLAARRQAAHRLALAAEAMDDAAVLTLDAWCQRMLREHAFDSGCLFDEDLVASEAAVLRDAIGDYWRMHVYTLDQPALRRWQGCLGKAGFEKKMHALAKRAEHFPTPPPGSLGSLAAPLCTQELTTARILKKDWLTCANVLEQWLADNRGAISGKGVSKQAATTFFAGMRAWARDDAAFRPDKAVLKQAHRFCVAHMEEARNNAYKSRAVHQDFAKVDELFVFLKSLTALEDFFLAHAVPTVAACVAALKHDRREFSFSDMLSRLRQALEGANAEALRARILAQYPAAMVDEFQDTSPEQYRVLDLLYRVVDNDAASALLLIGDPKQAIYGFRGADIQSYLRAREATAGRHYRLRTNFRSTPEVVGAINHFFHHAEGRAYPDDGYPGGAFLFRTDDGNPVPFDPVTAWGRKERFVTATGAMPALTLWCHSADVAPANAMRRHFSAQCASTITALLNDPACGFVSKDGFTRLAPADIAVLVSSAREAGFVQRALQVAGVASVYLSDKDSIFGSSEAADLLRWLRAIAAPLDAGLGRAALATRAAGLPLGNLASHASDDLAWEARVDMFKRLRRDWQYQGVLAMLRRFMHEVGIVERLVGADGGERVLTNLLHLSELCHAASQKLDGEQALIRWLAEQIDNDEAQSGDDRVLRLESDARLVQVVTVHKSKGLEYPLVFLPFATTNYEVDKSRHHFEYADATGARVLDLKKTDQGQLAADALRLQEEVRLLYVAFTRARHAICAGVMSTQAMPIEKSAFGYLVARSAPVRGTVLADTLERMAAGCAHIRVQVCDVLAPAQRLQPREDAPALIRPARYAGQFERDWSAASYSSITRRLDVMVEAPVVAAGDLLLQPDDPHADEDDDADDMPVRRAGDTGAWHQFPHGPKIGTFLHLQLEWMAGESFARAAADPFAVLMGQRCAHAGWESKADEVVAWLRGCVDVVLPPLGCALAELDVVVPEMEFWLPATKLDLARLDQACRSAANDGFARPALRQSQVHGMLRGAIDLVCERDGRYWVLDYKSSFLGKDDAAYGAARLAERAAQKRYDVQGAIYMHALHALLQSRLGNSYDPQRHLGGVIVYFIRGIGNATTRGCHHIVSTPALRSTLDAMLGTVTLRKAA